MTYEGDLGQWGQPPRNLKSSPKQDPEIDPERAVEWLKQASQGQIASAAYALGLCHLIGGLVDRDEGAGVALIAKASKSGHARALRLLGCAWSDGIGMKRDEDKAIRCWMRAAKGGDAESKAIIAEAIATGKGGRAGTDADTAAEMWAEAGASGDSNAWYNLGVLYAGGGVGEGGNMTGSVPVDDDLSMRCWRRAAKMGHSFAQFNVGIDCLERGRDASAAKWLARSAYGGCAEAMHSLGVLYIQGRVGVGGPSVNRAFKWFSRAADKGVLESQYNAGLMLTSPAVKGDEERKRGAAWLKSAAMMGHHGSFMAYAQLVSEGGIFEGEEEEEGLMMLREASKAGDSEAQFRLASLKLHRGGTDRDVLEYDEEGMALLRKAAGAGHSEAKLMLAACIAEFREAGGVPLIHSEYSVLHTCIQLHGACIPCSTPNDPKYLTNDAWHLTPHTSHLTPQTTTQFRTCPTLDTSCALPHTPWSP